MIVEYRIDADDVLIEVGQGWASFARENDAAELARPEPGRTLWSYVTGEDVSEVWRLLVARARSHSSAAQVRVRCDAPAVRRWFDITLTVDEASAVRFRSVQIGEQERAPVPLIDLVARRDPDAPLLRVCSWCSRFLDERGWLAVEHYVADHDLLERSVLPGISHTICPDCEARVFGGQGEGGTPLG